MAHIVLARAWNNGKFLPNGGGYGIWLTNYFKDEYLDVNWVSITLELEGWEKPAELAINTDAFWGRGRELRSGMVSIACSETALHAVLLQVLSRFHRENPAIRLRVSNQSAPEAIDALRSGLAELAVVTMPPAPLSAPLEATVLASFREVAVCSTAFPLDSGRTFTLREIAALPLIALRRGTSTFDLYESLFRRHGLSYAPDIEAATSTQLLPLVKNGLGIAFVPDVLLPAPGIERLHLREGLPERAVCLIRRTDRPRSVAAAALETMLLSLQNK